MKIVIINYGAGNIQSIKFAFKRLGYDALLSDDVDEILQADRVIFPGVGEASSAMKKLCQSGLDKMIPDLKQPVLGICLGMQLMCKSSEEGPTTGLGIFDVDVKRFSNQVDAPLTMIKEGGSSSIDPKMMDVRTASSSVGTALQENTSSGVASKLLGTSLKIPQIGWNQIARLKSPLFKEIDENEYIYLVHSYYAPVCEATIAESEYGIPYSAALARDNFYGTQFHPEKSSEVGVRILKNFLQL